MLIIAFLVAVLRSTVSFGTAIQITGINHSLPVCLRVLLHSSALFHSSSSYCLFQRGRLRNKILQAISVHMIRSSGRALFTIINIYSVRIVDTLFLDQSMYVSDI